MLRIILLLGVGLLTAWRVEAINSNFADCPGFPGYCIVTGSPDFTYYKIGQSFANIVARDAGIPMSVMASSGSIENVQRMRYQNGVKLAVVQSDVILHYKKLAQTNREIYKLIKPLRVMLPLYPEEIHLLVSAQSNIRYLHDIRDARIAVGPRTSGSGLTLVALYELLFGKAPDKVQFYDSHDDALRAVTIDQTADVWVMTVGQGASRLQFPAAAKDRVKLLRFDPNHPVDRKALDGPYFAAEISQSSYAWLNENVPVLAVKAFLITQEYDRRVTKENIRSLTQSLCRNFDRLQQDRSAIWRDKSGNALASKWQDVQLAPVALAGGWEYSSDVLDGFASSDCRLGSRPAAVTAPNVQTAPTATSGCSSEELLLGFCK